MKAGQCPDMPFFVNDWLASTHVALMTPAEEGAYFHLLCHGWNDPDCCLPDNDAHLAQLSRLGDAWANGSGAKIRECFLPDLERPGKLFNARQRAVRLKQRDRIEAGRVQRSNAANARWNKRKQSGIDATALREDMREPMRGDASSPVSRPSSPISMRESAERPSFDEVAAYAQTIGLAEWKARDWFDEMEGCGWLDFQHRPVVAWKPMLNRVRTKWEADGRPMHPPASRFSQPNGDSTAKPKGEPVWVQIKATEKLIADCNAKLRAISSPAPTVFPEEAAAAEAKRKPLREQKAQLVERLTELNRLQAESGDEQQQ